MSFKPPRRAPGDRSHLERLVQALSVDEGIATERLRRWVSTMVLLGALERGGDDQHRFLLKGGVAIELRFKLRARATKDVDIIVISESDGDLLDALQDALAEPYLDFGFRIVDAHQIAHTPAQRMDVKITYKSKPWATLRLEASAPEAGAAEPEQIAAFSLAQLGLDGPALRPVPTGGSPEHRDRCPPGSRRCPTRVRRRSAAHLVQPPPPARARPLLGRPRDRSLPL